jgi:hypothetical protein
MDVYNADHRSPAPENEPELLGVIKETSFWNLPGLLGLLPF